MFGFNETRTKGAGIRAYEYAGTETIQSVRLQLEAIFWLCEDSVDTVVEYGMAREDAERRRGGVLASATRANLLDYDRLHNSRVISSNKNAICPLCLEAYSSRGFFSRMEQAGGREVVDLTVTQLNMFHVKELRYGEFNHRPYNVAWGHHHCNVVVRDAGIAETLNWMSEVLERNRLNGYLPMSNNSG